MKSKTLAWTIGMTLCAPLTMPVLLPAQELQENKERQEEKDKSDAAPVTQNSTNVTRSKLTPKMFAAFRGRFARPYRGFGTWPPK